MDPAFSPCAAFIADPTPEVMIDRDYVVRAVNPAYCQATEREPGELNARYLFDAFPNNPGDPRADGVENALASFDRVLRTGRPDNLLIQRHDIPDPRRPGGFLRRDWMPVHAPLYSGDEVVGILVNTSDVTLLRQDVREAMQYFRTLLPPGGGVLDEGPAEPHQHQQMVDALTDGIGQFNTLADEVSHMREALTTRGVIEQAKGMLMMAQGCSTDEAFDLLRRAAQADNKPLTQVAARMVKQLTRTPQAAPGRIQMQRHRRRAQAPDTFLTPREREVVKLIAEGSSSKEVAATLAISVKTVDRHRSNILTKLGLRDQIGLVKYAIRTGLVEP